MSAKSCFVIIGYGKKTSYVNGKARELDLDQTYTILIKPVFDALGIPCYRAIDKNTSGSIDKLMLAEIKNAYIALADISTLNANVMWELGVRHALKPHHTIMICEKAQMAAIPFDINSFVIHQYTHSEEGIPYTEVERFRKYLTETVEKILRQEPPVNDSPVFTFLADELLNESASEQAMQEVKAEQEDAGSFVSIVQNAEDAKKRNDFEEALRWLELARKLATANMTLKDDLSFIIARQALCTYKSEKPSKREALVAAEKILAELNPLESGNLELLGLSGAISKRLFELCEDVACLDNAVLAYERGFQLKQDYYNGINAAFMLYRKAAMLKKAGDEAWEDAKLKADYLRNEVLKVALQLETEQLKGRAWTDFLPDAEDKNFVWALYTVAEAYNYKENPAKMLEYEEKAGQLASKFGDDFAPGSYAEQKNKIKSILQSLG